MHPLSRKRLSKVLKELNQGGCREVAKRLLDAGCFGHRRRKSTCPVAQYLRKKKFEKLLVGERLIIIPNDVPMWIPRAIQNFIRKFDYEACYQALVQTDAPEVS